MAKSNRAAASAALFDRAKLGRLVVEPLQRGEMLERQLVVAQRAIDAIGDLMPVAVAQFGLLQIDPAETRVDQHPRVGQPVMIKVRLRREHLKQRAIWRRALAPGQFATLGDRLVGPRQIALHQPDARDIAEHLRLQHVAGHATRELQRLRILLLGGGEAPLLLQRIALAVVDRQRQAGVFGIDVLSLREIT